MDQLNLNREIEALEMALFVARSNNPPNQRQVDNILRAIKGAKEELLRQMREERQEIDRQNAHMRHALDILREREARRGNQ